MEIARPPGASAASCWAGGSERWAGPAGAGRDRLQVALQARAPRQLDAGDGGGNGVAWKEVMRHLQPPGQTSESKDNRVPRR